MMPEDFSSKTDRTDKQRQGSREPMLLPMTAAIVSVAPMAFGCFLGGLVGGSVAPAVATFAGLVMSGVVVTCIVERAYDH